MTRQAARQRASEYVGEGRLQAYGFTPAIIDDATRETTLGWVFFYNSREYLETADVMQGLAGNAPIFVSKRDGFITPLGTARPIDEYIAEVEEKEKTRLA